MDCLGLLVRHFFGRFFDNEIVSQHGDMRTNVVQAIGLVATRGIFVPFYSDSSWPPMAASRWRSRCPP
jgi:hypothetical protein